MSGQKRLGREVQFELPGPLFFTVVFLGKINAISSLAQRTHSSSGSKGREEMANFKIGLKKTGLGLKKLS